MRKIKKINGYLVVKFNDRELREWDGTALGNYGVIDAELYTGCLEIDRSVMEYDGAETLEEAIEQARGLESELDAEEPEVTVTVIKETDETTIEEEPVDPVELFESERHFLEQQITNKHYPDTDERTAAHELNGFRRALERLGIIDKHDERFLPVMDERVKPEHRKAPTFPETPPSFPPPHPNPRFGCTIVPIEIESPEDWEKLKQFIGELPRTIVTDSGAEFTEPVKEPLTFEHLPPEKRDSNTAKQVYSLGRILEDDCPENDCRLYLNTFNMCRELDEQAPLLTGWPRQVVEADLRKHYLELEGMFVMNHAIKEFKRGLQP
ncbi:hypothetical protein SDC9_80458 [bioreactor metagenome]|uniref:Uncharacterized protein n=1 Tax=bioreactor metagenome TaxID=1076179 RepID=A0A644YZT6_9ZZZZ